MTLARSPPVATMGSGGDVFGCIECPGGNSKNAAAARALCGAWRDMGGGEVLLDRILRLVVVLGTADLRRHGGLG